MLREVLATSGVPDRAAAPQAVRRAIAIAIVTAAVAVPVACSGGEGPPVCPNGNCDLPGSTVVKWKFNHYPDLMFESDACSDVGAVTVRVEATNMADPAITETLEKGCGESQATFLDLPAGSYSFAITVLDVDGASLLKAPVTAMGLAGASGANVEIPVVVPSTSWARAYTGQFLYRLAWGAVTVSCADATPPVREQRLTLTAGGQVVTQTNDRGDKLDGSQDRPCWPLTEQFPQNVMNLPFGPATFRVQGKDMMNKVVYEKQFDTFIGAGAFNPTLTFVVPPVVDGGVDAPPDTM